MKFLQGKEDESDTHRYCAGGTITNGWDLLNRLSSQTTALGVVSYDEYDALNRLRKMTPPGQPQIVYDWDEVSRMRTITQGTMVVGYQWDDANRRTLLTLPNNVPTQGLYDDASRVTGLIYGTGGALGDLRYTYDPAGNRTSVGGTLAQTLLPDAVASTSYDAANRQLAFGGRTMTYDNNGNLATLTDAGGQTVFTWDIRNRLTALSAPTTQAAFSYDGLGRRIAKTIAGLMTNYFYDDVDVLQEIVGASQTPYLRGRNLDEPLVRGGAEYYLTDALGSAFGLTDSTGTAITTSYTYEPFGRTAVQGAASTNPFQFTAREHDETGFYFYRARFYGSDVDRFLSEDPKFSPVFNASECRRTFVPGVHDYNEVDPRLAQLVALSRFEVSFSSLTALVSPNPMRIHSYAYAGNSPITKADPTGLWEVSPQTPGCDYVGSIPPFNSPCAQKCCNEHDECYVRAHRFCSAWTWFTTIAGFRSECDTCNGAVFGCLISLGASVGERIACRALEVAGR